MFIINQILNSLIINSLIYFKIFDLHCNLTKRFECQWIIEFDIEILNPIKYLFES